MTDLPASPLRPYHNLPRLYCDAPMAMGVEVLLSGKQAHYLNNVLRMKAGAALLVFNGRDGEWRACLEGCDKKQVRLLCEVQTRAQTPPTDLVYCFAPLKTARLDYMVQKAVEMGVSRLQPVITRFTQNSRLNIERMRANVVEAVEQCGILSIPSCGEPMPLTALLENWKAERQLIFCDEARAGTNSLAQLTALPLHTPLALLIGPEGGFDAQERNMLVSTDFVTSIGLGPRILRADTAAVAALALIGATIGDWVT